MDTLRSALRQARIHESESALVWNLQTLCIAKRSFLWAMKHLLFSSISLLRIADFQAHAGLVLKKGQLKYDRNAFWN
jgi:hypothetical protein